MSLFALLPLLLLGPEPCEHLIDGITPRVQRGPMCALAASAMALDPFGASLDPLRLAREVPFHVDGTSFFDLQEALTARGFTSFAFQGDAALVARFVAGGLPVVAAVAVGGEKHAITISGVRGVALAGICHPIEIRLIDPRSGATTWRSSAELARTSIADQLFVAFPADLDPSRLAGVAADLAAIRVQNARFRSREWIRRALAHGETNAQVVTLLERAAAEDPGWSEAQRLLRLARDELARQADSAPRVR